VIKNKGLMFKEVGSLQKILD